MSNKVPSHQAITLHRKWMVPTNFISRNISRVAQWPKVQRPKATRQNKEATSVVTVAMARLFQYPRVSLPQQAMLKASIKLMKQEEALQTETTRPNERYPVYPRVRSRIVAKTACLERLGK